MRSDWLDYATAFGTVAAVVVALLLGTVELWRWRRERGDRRKDQAQHVAAWCEVFLDGPGDGKNDTYGVRTYVVNTSSLPVYDACFYYNALDDEQGVWVERRRKVVTLLPGQQVSTGWERQPDDPGGGRAVAVSFRDAAGRWWARDERGALNELSGEPPVKRAGQSLAQ